ncbi:MAG: DUF1570 domain-containing protein [Planctomycetota bacterium]
MIAVAACSTASTYALERVVALKNGRATVVVGEAIVEGPDGGVMLQSADGGLHILTADQIESRSSDDAPLEMLDAEALAEQLLAETPPGFQIHQSTNYVICYNTTRTYARWCSSLLERLQKSFIAFWKKQGCDVRPPEHPLPVLVFGDQNSYARHAKDELGASAGAVIGFYSLASNRVMMYDLTGNQSLQREAGVRGSLHDISALLSLPEAEPLVATIVHEATHQIAYNCGLQTRFADNPLWLSEGLAAFFETPDLSRSRAWAGIGQVNYSRWDRFQDAYAARRTVPLQRLLLDDALLRNRDTAVDGYAQAWAWNYFLIRWRPKQYAAYLQALAVKPRLLRDSPERRLADFQEHFGDDFGELETDFQRRMSRIR